MFSGPRTSLAFRIQGTKCSANIGAKVSISSKFDPHWMTSAGDSATMRNAFSYKRGQGIGQVEYFGLVVAVVMEEFGGIQKVFLDVVHRPGRHGEGGDRQAVLTHLRLVGFEGFVIGDHVHVFKHIGQHLQVVRGLDGMLLDPGHRGARAPHLLAVHGAGA